MSAKTNQLQQLRQDLLRFEGVTVSGIAAATLGLGPLQSAFPLGLFPKAATHEFLWGGPDGLSATTGWLAGLLSHLMGAKGSVVWVSAAVPVFAPALVAFNIKPERILFVRAQQKDIAWATEEALKCNALSAVVAELRSLDFTTSRRFQLAVEQSGTTGLLLNATNHERPNTSVSRWRITHIPSITEGLPGVGLPAWRIELLRMRNARPGVWHTYWKDGRLESVEIGASQQRAHVSGVRQAS